MTPAQKARAIGFNALLNLRGVSLSLAGTTITGLVEELPPDAAQFSLSQETRSMVRIAFLHSDVAPLNAQVGDTFTDGNGGSYRVAAIETRPWDFVQKFRCEATR